MSEEFENIKENAEDMKDDIRDERKEEFKAKVEDMKSEVKDAYENVKDQAQDTFKDVKEGAAAAFAAAKEKAQAAAEEIKEEVDDYSGEMDAEDVSKNKLMAVLAYIGPLVLLPILLASDSKFAKFHANQGLVLFLLAIVCALLSKLKVIGWLFGLCGTVVFIFAIVGIVYALQGRAKELPVVGNWVILK